LKNSYTPINYHTLPKIELHRHLEGSLRFETIQEIVHQADLDLPRGEALRALVQFRPGQPLSLTNLLAKFRVLRALYRSPEIIQRVVQEAIADAAADHIHYLELRFTPFALSQACSYPLASVMDWVIDATRLASIAYGLPTRLIASLNRHEEVSLAAQVAELAAERLSAGIVGLDLAGDEGSFPAGPFINIFSQARQKGLRLSIHAGEWGNGAHNLEAIEEFGAERIGHGIRILESPQAVQLAVERGIVFEVCPTSNYQSGVVPDLSAHPLKQMLDSGLKVTLNTDNPAISQIDLSGEYRLAAEQIGLTKQQLLACRANAVQAAFLPTKEIQKLAARLFND
jgi:adenosine deaminase